MNSSPGTAASSCARSASASRCVFPLLFMLLQQSPLVWMCTAACSLYPARLLLRLRLTRSKKRGLSILSVWSGYCSTAVPCPTPGKKLKLPHERTRGRRELDSTFLFPEWRGFGYKLPSSLACLVFGSEKGEPRGSCCCVDHLLARCCCC